MNRQIRRDELENGLFSSYQATCGSGLVVLACGPLARAGARPAPAKPGWPAPAAMEPLTPPRRWERSCAAPSLVHPLTAPRAHPHNHR
jgi:hypothetical protein